MTLAHDIFVELFRITLCVLLAAWLVFIVGRNNLIS